MTKTLTIDPVTRIEGHARVLLNLNDDGTLDSAGLVVNELRGFERILVGMEAERMPLVTARICGVCPSAHHLAAAKALDDAAQVTPPPAAKLLRELLYMGHFIHSHSLSLFALQGPDLILGLDADPAIRNIVGVVKAVPEIARKALRLRTLGQKINEMIGGRGIHPVTSIVGGITFVLDSANKEVLKKWIDESLVLVQELAGVAKDLLYKLLDKHPVWLNTISDPTWYLSTIKDKNGQMNFYDGHLRVMDSDGAIRDEFDIRDYKDYLVESTLDWSYMKPVHFKHKNELFLYRVNTLGRINCTDSIETPLADQELQQFRKSFGRPCHITVMHVYARVIELIYACEKAKMLIEDPAINGETRVPAIFRGHTGIGHVEAPRGTLIHEYEIDDKGIVRRANLIVATQQNYDGINRSIAQAAEHYLAISHEEAMMNSIEFAIRCYDPCLSCSTHAVGQMPLDVIIKQGDKVLRRIRREN